MNAPTLVRPLPPPVRKLIGDISDAERVLIGLDLYSCLTRDRPGQTQPSASGASN